MTDQAPSPPFPLGRDELVAVGARIAAVYFAASAAPMFLGGAISLVRGGEWHGFAGSVTLGTSTLLLAAAVLWFFPLTIARKLLPAMRDVNTASGAESRRVFTTATMVVGVWLLANGLLDAIYWGVHLANLERMQMNGVEFSIEQRANMIATAAQVGLGIALLLGADGLRRAVERLRYGHHSSIP